MDYNLLCNINCGQFELNLNKFKIYYHMWVIMEMNFFRIYFDNVLIHGSAKHAIVSFFISLSNKKI